MPVRFRKSFTLFPGVKVNLSKGGMSITVGTKGMHLNFSKRGVRQTVGLPGSGISESSYVVKNEPKSETEKSAEKDEQKSEEAVAEKPKRRTRRAMRESASSPWGFFAFVLIAVVIIYFGGMALGLLPPNLLTNFLHTLTQWTQRVGL